MGMKYKIENKNWNLVKSFITIDGEFTKEFMDYWNSLKDKNLKYMIALMTCGKIRTNELPSLESIRLIKGSYWIKLKGLKGSRDIRELAVIQPFYDHIMDDLKNHKKIFAQSTKEHFLNEYSIRKLFEDILKPKFGKQVCNRSFEKLTMTYVSMNTSKGNTSLSKITGHESPKNVESYIATPELKPLNVSKRLEGDLKKLSLQNLMIANDLYEELEDMRNHNLVIESKLDKILKLLES